MKYNETWLSERDKSCDYKMNGYQSLFRRDRTVGSTGHGGVAAYVSDNIACKRRRNLEIPEIEGLWLEINVVNTKFLLLVIYRTESNSNNLFWQTLQNNIDDVRSENNLPIMIIGDLNADPQTRHGRCLREFADNNFFTIHVKEPTRITENSASILDQILTNFPTLVKEVNVDAPLSTSDHCLISAKCLFKIKRQKVYMRRMWNFGRANFDLFRQTLAEIDWENSFQSENLNDICKVLQIKYY